MKKSIVILTSVIILNSCSAATSASDYSFVLPEIKQNSGFNFVFEEAKRQKQQEAFNQEIAEKVKEQQASDMNKHLLLNNSKEIIQHVDTPYIYSGATPNGWDCSGLVVWYYEQLDIPMPHSASAQTSVGTVVDEPQNGDIVIVKQPGKSNFHHSAIYIGDNNIIHAGWQRGDKTEIISLDDKYLSGSEIMFVRVMN